MNRESFMNILSVIWRKWANKNSILNFARKVGMTQIELNADFMDQKAFKKAEAVTISTPIKSNQKLVIELPENVRHGSAEYWRKKFECAETVISDLQHTPVTPLQHTPIAASAI